jgi:hypothetical protein
VKIFVTGYTVVFAVIASHASAVKEEAKLFNVSATTRHADVGVII